MYITGTLLMWLHQLLVLKFIILNFVSDVYGLMRIILYLIFFAPYYNVTVPLVQQCVISNGLLYVVSYLKSELLLRMTLSPTLSMVYSFNIFADVIFINLRLLSLVYYFPPHHIFICRIILRPNTNWPRI